MDKGIRPGRYRHYKGLEYIVYGTARHSETEEILVIYRTDYGDKDHWARPISMFLEKITLEDGNSAPRFKFISEQ